MHSTPFLLYALVEFAFLAWLYYRSNKVTDKFQPHILAFFTGAGCFLGWRLGFEPVWVFLRAVVVGLLGSDLAHLVVPGLLQRREDGFDRALGLDGEGEGDEKV